jgi:hypothetical protein
VTWFPLDGSYAYSGANTGTLPTPTGATFAANPATGAGGQYLKFGSGSASAGLTAAQLGISGNASRTLFFEYYHADNNTGNVGLFALGAGSSDQDFSAVKNGYTALKINFWNNDLSADIAGSGDNVIRGVLTHDGSTVTLYYRVYRYTPSNGDAVGWKAAGTPITRTGSLNTASSATYPLTIAGWPATGATGGDGAGTGLAYLGIVGGVAWNATQASAFLADPTPLWTSSGPAAITGTGAVTIAGPAVVGSGAVTIPARRSVRLRGGQRRRSVLRGRGDDLDRGSDRLRGGLDRGAVLRGIRRNLDPWSGDCRRGLDRGAVLCRLRRDLDRGANRLRRRERARPGRDRRGRNHRRGTDRLRRRLRRRA